MSYNVDESTMMAYLYGELSAEEQQKFELFLQDNPQVQAQLQDLGKVSTLLGRLDDQEPITPIVMNTRPKRTVMRSLIPWLSVAAAVCLLVIVGYATDLKVNYQNGQLAMGFGAVALPDQGITQQQMVPLIENALDRQKMVYSDQLNELKLALEEKIAQNQQQVTQVATQPATPSLNEQALQAYLVQYQQQNLQQMAQLLQSNTQIQREELQTFLAEYHQFLEERRLQDLQLIEAGFQAMQDNVNQQQSETEQILANIITSVNSTNY